MCGIVQYVRSKVRVDRKEHKVEWPGDRGAFTGGGDWGSLPEYFLFSSKNAGFLPFFIAKNYTCGQKQGPGELIDLLGTEDVKRRGVENLAEEGFNPQPLSTSTLVRSLAGVDCRCRPYNTRQVIPSTEATAAVVWRVSVMGLKPPSLPPFLFPCTSPFFYLFFPPKSKLPVAPTAPIKAISKRYTSVKNYQLKTLKLKLGKRTL